jgi:aminoglycoside phosphotransferase (APT) family kinase protein
MQSPNRPCLAPQWVSAAVAAALGDAVDDVEHVPVGYGNENWRASMSSGVVVLAKFGPLASLSKWRSAGRAVELAAAAGVPTSPLLHLGTCGGRLVRIFRWTAGNNPDPGAMDPSMVAAMFSTLGQAVASLHGVALDKFSSRLDGSAPAFGSWAGYLGHRLGQVVARCREYSALSEPVLTRMQELVGQLAAAASPEAAVTLVHRDLHADNLLVGTDGRLAAILDFDMAEAWDRAGEWFKLSRFLFPAFPGGEDHFMRAYLPHHPAAALWPARRRVVDLIETANAIPNAMTQGQRDRDREAAHRRHLDWLLDAELTGG